MADDKAKRGEALMRRVDGDKVAEYLLTAFDEVAPDFARYLTEFAFGEIYARDGDLRQRELVAIASLTTMGNCEPQLETHLRAASRVGLTQAETLEALMTLVPYIGFPKVMNALTILKRIAEKTRA